jgi:hypothetical protein
MTRSLSVAEYQAKNAQLAQQLAEAQQTYTVFAPVVMSSGQMSSIVWVDEWEVGE